MPRPLPDRLARAYGRGMDDVEMALGMSESEASLTSWRGTDQGTQMKTDYGWNNGNDTNSSGFSGLPGGFRTFRWLLLLRWEQRVLVEFLARWLRHGTVSGRQRGSLPRPLDHVSAFPFVASKIRMILSSQLDISPLKLPLTKSGSMVFGFCPAGSTRNAQMTRKFLSLLAILYGLIYFFYESWYHLNFGQSVLNLSIDYLAIILLLAAGTVNLKALRGAYELGALRMPHDESLCLEARRDRLRNRRIQGHVFAHLRDCRIDVDLLLR